MTVAAGSAIVDPPLPELPAGLGQASFGQWLRRFLGFMGPGYLIAVGYMDPGNWATDLAAGSGFGYSLLWVIMLWNLMAVLLQILAIRLGLGAGLDLAQACRLNSSKYSARFQWIACEIAICACDLAEVIGSAIALNLLFHLSMPVGVALTAFDVVLVAWLQGRGMRYLQAVVIALMTVIFCCFTIMLLLADPVWANVMTGLIPAPRRLANPEALYLAIGIIGATVMPHNLYLHSSIVQKNAAVGKVKTRDAIKFASIDIGIALFFACIVNGAILILSGAVFHAQGQAPVADIQDAHRMLSPLLGSAVAGTLFALALLASGQSSTMTATMAGQIVMEGFLQRRMKPWVRRLLTRSVAIVPALVVAGSYGEAGMGKLLVLSQVILSLQLPLAVIPLIRYTSRPAIMGPHVNPRWLTVTTSAIAVLIVLLNASMIVNFARSL